MNKRDIELIEDMLHMQKELDEEIYRAHGLKQSDISYEQYDKAILDEVGELNHELKKTWCWWKFSQPEVDEEKVLGELVDVWHFVLSYLLKRGLNLQEFEEELFMTYKDVNIENEDDGISAYDLCDIVQTYNCVFKLAWLVRCSEHLGFNVQTVYVAYVNKNEINHERVEEGY